MLRAVIDQQKPAFSAIIRINRAGRIEHGDTVSAREPRARPYLRFGARRQRDCDAGRNCDVVSARL